MDFIGGFLLGFVCGMITGSSYIPVTIKDWLMDGEKPSEDGFYLMFWNLCFFYPVILLLVITSGPQPYVLGVLAGLFILHLWSDPWFFGMK
ncbi:MAG: hypothetical protein ACJ0BU_01580 [Candidatus Puniceispirillales bacterium]